MAIDDETDWADMIPVLMVGEDFYTEESIYKLLTRVEQLEKELKLADEKYTDLNKRTNYLLGALEHGRKKDIDGAIKDVQELLDE